MIDDNGAKTLVGEFGPLKCGELASPRVFDYLNCGAPKSVDLQKNWPVIFAADSPLTINEAVFATSGKIENPVVTATAQIAETSGKKLDLKLEKYSGLKLDPSDGQLTVQGLTFSGKLPALPEFATLSITWTVQDGDQSLKAGISDDDVFITAAPYVQKQQFGIGPYLSLLAVGTAAAEGKKGPQEVFGAIWDKFKSLELKHPVLDAKTGKITGGSVFTYYKDGWTDIAARWNDTDDDICQSPVDFLLFGKGRCGAWSYFLFGVLAYQGIVASVVDLANSKGFDLGPEPAKDKAPNKFVYMLVGRSLWKMDDDKTKEYTNIDPLVIKGEKIVVGDGAVHFTPSKIPIAQGKIASPPVMFKTGDHAIVEVFVGDEKPVYVDPSYGEPAKSAPYASLKEYEDANIAGFAVVWAKTKSEKPELLEAVNPQGKQTIIKRCSQPETTCTFAVVPLIP